MKAKLLASLLLLFLSTAPLPSLAQDSRIAVVLPLSGPVAELGSAIRQGLELAEEEDRQMKVERNLEFDFEDDSFDPSKSVSAVRRLLASGHHDAFVIVGSGNSMATGPILEQAKIPTLSVSVAKEVSQGKRFIFRHYLETETEARLLAEEALRLRYQEIAVVTTQSDAMISIREPFLRKFTGRVVFSEEILPAERDVRAIASRIKQKNPQAVFLCLMTPQGGILAKALREIGFQGSFFSAHPVEIDPEALRPEGSLSGSWFVGNDIAGAQEFETKYQAKFHKPAPIGAANGYDIAKLLKAALNSQDPVKYLEQLKSYSGALGVYGSTADHGFSIPGAIHKIP